MLMPRKEFGKVLIKIEFLFSPINGKDKDPCQSWKHESKKGKNKDTHRGLAAERFQKFRVQLFGSTNKRKQNMEAKLILKRLKRFT